MVDKHNVISNKSDFLKLLIGLALFVLISMDRNLIFIHYLFDRGSMVYLSSFIMLTLLLSILVFLLINKKLKFNSNNRHLAIIILMSSAYFAFHELIVGDYLIAAKYSILLMIVFFLLGIRPKIMFIYKVIAIAGIILSFSILLQQLLLFIAHNGQIDPFQVAISGDQAGRNMLCDFVNPFNLGYMERCATVNFTFGSFELNRSLSFTREPKYIGSILLLTLACSLISNIKRTPKIVFLYIYMAALFCVLSFTAFIVLIVAFALLKIRLNAITYSVIAFVAPITLLPWISNRIFQDIGTSFIFTRIISGADSIGEGVFDFGSYSLIGSGAAEDLKIVSDGLLYNIYGQYGLIGFILTFLLFFLFTKNAFIYNLSNNRDSLVSFGLLILINCILFFNFYFFSDLFNFYSSFSILTLILVPTYLLTNPALTRKFDIEHHVSPRTRN